MVLAGKAAYQEGRPSPLWASVFPPVRWQTQGLGFTELVHEQPSAWPGTVDPHRRDLVFPLLPPADWAVSSLRL